MKPSGDGHIYELLRAANPVTAESLPESSRSVMAQALYERIVADSVVDSGDSRVPLPRRRRFPSLRFSLASLVAVVGVGAGVSYALSSGGATHRSTIACYASPRLDANFSVYPAGGADPVATCGRAWASGGIGGQPPAANQWLRACQLPAGIVGVFPASAAATDPCTVLHLPAVAGSPPPPGSPPPGSPGSPGTPPASTSADPVATMSAAVSQALASGCLNEASAMAAIHGALGQGGLTNWTAEVVAPFTADRPCASPGFDEDNHVVLIIPIPHS